MHHRHDRSIARHPPRRFRGNADPVKIRAPGLALRSQSRGVTVDHHLIPLRAGTGFDARLAEVTVVRVMRAVAFASSEARRQRPLRQQPDRVRPALLRLWSGIADSARVVGMLIAASAGSAGAVRITGAPFAPEQRIA